MSDTKVFNADLIQRRDSVLMTTTPGKRVGEKRFFFAGSGKWSLAAAGDLKASIQNPSNSGRNVFIDRIAALATGTAWAGFFINPTAGVPTTTPRRANNAVIGAPNGLAVIRIESRLSTDIGTSPLGGGTDTGLTLGIPANQRVSLELPPLVLAPGVVLGLNIPFAGAADASMSLYWWEEDV